MGRLLRSGRGRFGLRSLPILLLLLLALSLPLLPLARAQTGEESFNDEDATTPVALEEGASLESGSESGVIVYNGGILAAGADSSNSEADPAATTGGTEEVETEDDAATGEEDSSSSSSAPSSSSSSTASEEEEPSSSSSSSSTGTSPPGPVVPRKSSSNNAGLWTAILSLLGVILGVICLERFYSSCRRTIRRRSGRDGFAELQRQHEQEMDEEADAIELEEDMPELVAMQNHLQEIHISQLRQESEQV